MSTSTPHLQIVPLCLLCRARTIVGLHTDIIAFCDAPPHLVIRRGPISGSISTTFREAAASSTAGGGQDVDICYFPHHGCEPVARIHAIHVACWKLARGDHTARSLVALARRSVPLFPAKIGGFPSDVLTIRADFCKLSPRQSTSLGRLIVRICAELPTEMQAQIVAELGEEDDLACLARATHVAASSPVVTHLHPGPARELRTSPGPVTHISASKSHMFGREYLRDIQLHCSEDCAEDARTETVAVRQVGLLGVRFAIDRHGIRGLRVVYGDGSESPLLGSDKECWHGEAPGESLEELWVTRDDFRVIRIDLGYHSTDVDPGRRHRALFSCRSPLTEGLTNVISAPSPWTPSPISFYPNWRFIEYAPLSRNGAYTSGITVFLEEGNVLGLHVAGPRQQVSGHPGNGNGAVIGKAQGAPHHLALGPREQITGAWLRQPDFGYADCSLVLMTSTGRVHFLHNYNQYQLSNTSHNEWTSLTNTTPCEIRGIFLDSVRNDGNLGASWAPSSGGTIPPLLPNFPRKPKADGRVFSVASLHGVKAVSAMKQPSNVTPRIAGLYIEYHSGGVAALGRWDPRQADAADIIWRASSDMGPLKGIAFRMDKRRIRTSSPFGHRVDEVVPMTSQEPPAVGTWNVFEARSCEGIVWSWSEGSRAVYEDVLEAWDGTTERAGPHVVGNVVTVS